MVGYDAKNKDILDKKYICPICSLILRNPIQLKECGHRQCQSCFDTQHGTIMKCLQCSTEIIQNQITFDCGFENDMKHLPTECSCCDWIGVLSDYRRHLEKSHSNPKCEHCDEQYDSIDKFYEHKVSLYRNKTIECLLTGFGCDEHIFSGDLSDHYLSEEHQNLLCKVIHQLNLQLENERTSSIITDTNLSASRTVTVVDPDITHFQEMIKTVMNFLCDTTMWNNNEIDLNKKLLQYQLNFPTIKLDFFQVKLAVQDSNCMLDTSASDQDAIKHFLASLKDRLYDRTCISCDGMFLWKITNIKEKMTDAQSERQVSIDSPPFYTSPMGYKMCVRLYLYGDGNARTTHMSIFTVLMKGEYDSSLRFPFNCKVTFSLDDQIMRREHIIDSFRPDIRSNSFERPQSNMNIASGIPKFVSLSTFQQNENPYVRDNTMFIKVIVDFGDVPKILLPYIFNLNPGLPAHIRQQMIQQEMERRTQQ